MAKVRFPYGISNFKLLQAEDYIYVDRTAFIEKIENANSRYNFFLRPRRFGKSLAVSMMQYYYGLEHKADFDALFGKLYIGQHPTPNANRYRMLSFDFSGIMTDDMLQVDKNFARRVRTQVLISLTPYGDRIPENELKSLNDFNSANDILETALQLLRKYCPDDKVMVVIDEYDHFTNEIIAFNFDNFREIVSQNGFVRKFYEVLKWGTQIGTIDRIFITGVSPVTLDSLTSGFNIGTNLSLDLAMHDFLGFTEEETGALLRVAGVEEAQYAQILGDIRAWYNGYLFNLKATNRLYNPDMVLYFAAAYAQYHSYPDSLLDTNISSDYGKIRRMFKVGNQGANYDILEEIMREGSVTAEITRQFSFEKQWTRDDFISLLFYMGLLTIREKGLTDIAFQVPNHVIAELYYKYFRDLLLESAQLHIDDMRMSRRIEALALHNDIRPLMEALEMVLQRLANRDARGFDEKYVKMALMALLVPAGVYGVFSEYPIGQRYADIAMWRRPPVMEPKYQYLLEIKHLKKQDAARLPEVAAEGRAQLQAYLAHPDIARKGDVVGWLIVFCGYEAALIEELH